LWWRRSSKSLFVDGVEDEVDHEVVLVVEEVLEEVLDRQFQQRDCRDRQDGHGERPNDLIIQFNITLNRPFPLTV
jgi:hypothetical protein